MSLTNSSEYNALGGGFSGGLGGFGGGFGGGIAPFGLLGLLGIGDLGRKKDGDKDCQGKIALLAAIGNAKDVSVAEARALAAGICETKSDIKDAAYASAIQSERNTAQLSAQSQAIAALTEKRLDDLAAAGAAQTAVILARLNDAEVQSLRDQLAHSHRHADSQDISIAISNSNAQTQAQIQAQAQIQTQRDFDHIRRFDSIFGSFNQLNKNTQDIVNFGTMAASGNQANQQTNVK